MPYLGDIDEKALVEEVPDVLLSERLLVVHFCVDVAMVEELHVRLLHLVEQGEGGGGGRESDSLAIEKPSLTG